MRSTRTDPSPRRGWRVALRAVIGAALLLLAGCGAAQAQTPSPEATVSPEAPPSPDVVPEDRIIYMVMTDRFSNGDPGNDLDSDPSQLLAWHGGDFRGLMEQLPYLVELGVTTIWITPIVDQIDQPVEGAGMPHWGYHGYWAENFDRLDPHLGTDADLSALLDAAHAAGLEVILDVVLNHPGYDSHFVHEDSWVRECPGEDEPHDDLTQCLFGLPDFRTEDPAIAQQLIAWQTAWFQRFPFDGLRADTVKHVGTDVWREFLASVRAVRSDPGFFTLGESWGTAPTTTDEPLLGEGLFDAMYDFGFADLMEGWLDDRMRSAALSHHLGVRNDTAIGHYVPYLDSHDTPTMVWRLDNDERYPLALVALLTSAGMPMLYYGDELGREGGEWPNNRPDMPWELAEDPAAAATPLALVRQLTAVRRAHPALSRGTYTELAADAGLVAYARESGDDRVVVGLNRGPDTASVACGEAAGVSCEPLICWNCLAGESEVSLAPNGAVVLVR